jgi:hypothetical protein
MIIYKKFSTTSLFENHLFITSYAWVGGILTNLFQSHLWFFYCRIALLRVIKRIIPKIRWAFRTSNTSSAVFLVRHQVIIGR